MAERARRGRRIQLRWLAGRGGLGKLFLFFNFFILFTEARNTTALVNATINYDVGSEAVAKTISDNAFYPPR